MRMRRSFILKENLEQEYLEQFNRYMIDVIYGDDILIGDDIEEQYRDQGV